MATSQYLTKILQRTALSLATSIFIPATVLAGSYGVQAIVPNDPPSQPAQFANNLNGMNTTNAEIQLNGTCQVANPNYVVTILRSGVVIGSVNCISGGFSLNTMLQEGENQFTARSANFNNEYGPDSSSITITLRPAPQPIAPAPLNPTAPTPEPTNPTEETIATNAGADSGLQAVTTEPFSTLTDNKTVTIGVNVGGGNSPYLINLNWGDGSVESHWVDQAGIYTYSHTYQTATNYQIRGVIRDVLGAMTIFDYAVVNNKPTDSSDAKAVGAGSSSPTPSSSNTWLFTAAVGGGSLLVAGLSYWLGRHRVVPVTSGQRSAGRQAASTANTTRKGAKRHVKKR